jgi:nitric-oxide synthase
MDGLLSGKSNSTLLTDALAFLDDPALGPDRRNRLDQVRREIETTGTYSHTAAELDLGCRRAWANSARCIGRLHVPALRVRDRRQCTSADEVAAECVGHIRYSTNNGNLRPTVTVFAPGTERTGRIRLWNSQLVRYAGYRQADGTIIGDPVNAELTTRIQDTCGWRGNGGRFDLLPLVVQFPGESAKAFEIPPDAVLEVPISHPDHPWFADLGLRWYALPAISDMELEIGGLVYPATFSGWYMDTEIGVRDLGDAGRYNMLPEIAARMGLDTLTHQSLWRDRALVELDFAVLHSFRQAGVRMVDHHTAAEQFARYLSREERDGRCVPADWAWLVPPMSGSTTEIFHREFPPADDSVRPNFVRPAQPPWSPTLPEQRRAAG